MNNFSNWIESPIPGQQVQDAVTFAEDEQRIDGFKAGKPASSLRVNTALRQANLVICALMQMCDDIQALPEDLTLLSTTTAVKDAIKAAIDKLDQAILTSSKQYTDSAVVEIDTDIRNLQNQITTNKNNIDTNSTAIEQRVTIDAFNAALAQKQDKGDYATNTAVETLLKQYFKIPEEITWTEGTVGSLTISEPGWYIFRANDEDDANSYGYSGIVLFDANKDIYYQYPMPIQYKEGSEFKYDSQIAVAWVINRFVVMTKGSTTINVMSYFKVA